MKKTVFRLFSVLMLFTMLLTACGGGNSDSGTKDTASKATVPADYAGKTNPVDGNQDAIAAGKDVFATNCASCHGDTGKGDGAASTALEPKPANLAGDAASGVKDDYLNWRIHEGGTMAPFNSSMPAFKGVLTDDQIWQVIAYIHTLK